MGQQAGGFAKAVGQCLGVSFGIEDHVQLEAAHRKRRAAGNGDDKIAAQPTQLRHKKGDAADGHHRRVDIDHQKVGRFAQQEGEVALAGVNHRDGLRGKCQSQTGGLIGQHGSRERGMRGTRAPFGGVDELRQGLADRKHGKPF
jgi:hypothetical protein